MSDINVSVGGGPGVVVSVTGNGTTATVTTGGTVDVTLTESNPSWSGITGKPSTFPPQAHSHFIVDTVGLQAALNLKADLDGGGKVPSSQLPSYVDDVLEYANLAALPGTGETGKIYVTLDNGKVFRWSGSTYIEISAAPGSTDVVPEGTTNLYHTTARAAAAAPVQSVAGRTGAITLAVGDVSNAVSTSDSRLSDSREWSAATVSQADAEAGTSTDRKAFTALRVFQAIAAWWAASSAKTKLDGIASGATANATDAQLRDRTTHTGTQLASTISDFSSAAVSAVTWSTLTGKPTFATVATTGAYADLSGTPAAYSLPTATASVLGGVKIGSGISIDGNGVISASSGYTLPNATTSTLGGVIVGTGLAVASGTVSVSFGTTSTTVAAGNHTHAQLHDRSHAITSSSDHTATAWRVFYSDGSGVVTELALGASGKVLQSNGAAAAPTWETPAGGGSTSASDLTSGTLAEARLNHIPFHPFLFMGG